MPDDSPAAPAAPESAPAPAAPATPSTPAPPESATISGEPSESILQEATPPTPTTPSTNFVNPDGTFVENWAKQLPEAEFKSELGDFRNKLSGYKSPADLARALKHANQLISQRGLIPPPPTPESSPEQVAEYRKAMGVPETPTAYAETVKPKVEVPEGVNWDDGLAGQYFEAAHRLNIPPEAMTQLIQLNLKQREFETKAQANIVEERKQENLNLLRRESGANFDRNVDLAQRAAARFGGSPDDPGFASPNMVRMWVRALKELGEDKVVGEGSSLPMGAANFRAKAKEIQTNPNHPDHKKYWDGDPEVEARVREYHRRAEQGH